MSSSSHDIFEEPQRSIGAADILKLGHCDRKGFLRRQTRLNRTFSFFKWSQQFVVVSRGCIYVFSDEYATSPAKARSLRLYNQLTRLAGPSPTWGFSLLPTDSKTTRSLVFCCTSEDERKEWMAVLNESMRKAHKVADALRASSMTDEYVYLEKEVVPAVVREPKPKPQPKVKAKAKAESGEKAKSKKPEPSAEEEEEEDGDEEEDSKDYDTINDLHVVDNPDKTGTKGRRRPPTIKPPPPTESYTVVDTKSKKPKSKAASPPASPRSPKDKQTPKGHKITRQLSEYEYDGSDRNEVEKILTLRPEGTYLVRKSRNDNRKVLSVNVEGVLKEFKIYEQDGQVTLNNQDFFSSLDELLGQYTRTRDLPNKTTRLYRGYSVTDPRYINQS